MMTVKRHFESIARAPRAHGIAMAWRVGGMQCGLPDGLQIATPLAMQIATNFAYSPVDSGVVKTL